MFEDEMKMEEQEGKGFGPILIIVAMIAILVGGVGYMIIESNRMLKPEEASVVAEKTLKTLPAAQVKFHTGHLVASMNDGIDRPQYKVLADAGIITIKTDKKNSASDVTLTPDGEAILKSIAGTQKKDESDGTTLYTVPVASRTFLKIEEIQKQSAKHFTAKYTWKWEPNKLGDIFDADGQYVKKFPTYERSQLIDKYGADFYHAAPAADTIAVVKSSDGWAFSNE